MLNRSEHSLLAINYQHYCWKSVKIGAFQAIYIYKSAISRWFTLNIDCRAPYCTERSRFQLFLPIYSVESVERCWKLCEKQCFTWNIAKKVRQTAYCFTWNKKKIWKTSVSRETYQKHMKTSVFHVKHSKSIKYLHKIQ